MIELAEKIARYIEYLRSVELCVSIHFTPESTARLPHSVWEKLLPYNSHNNPYCLTVKSCRVEDCIAHQRALISEVSEPGFKVCHAGVGECVFPVRPSSLTVGYVAVSGTLAMRNLVPSNAASWTHALSENAPPTELAQTLVPPLVMMLEGLLLSSRKFEVSEQNLISQYLAENHISLTFDNFCRHFSRSRSYMSHKFGKMFGKSFSAYCNDLRLEDAARLLMLGDKAVTDVALSCGFGDVSYFIRLFKAKYGVSPLKYRRSSAADK